ncbi:MAG: SCP2 sterol-binding domain-containing protein [Candidatus Lokiarchaeota archaeon]|nr:SCP2 sterol-binding domain-containing protein [Candidatus Lokiarchaeota archaeon]
MAEPTQTAPGENPVEVKKEKKKRLKGFAGMIANMLKPLNENARFKERFGAEVITFIINATDFPPAAIVKVNNGTVTFEDAQPDHVKKIKANAVLQGEMNDIMKVASGKVNPIAAIFKGKIKVKGPLKLLKLNKMFVYAVKQAMGSAPPSEPQPPAPGARPAPDSLPT